MTVSIPNQRLSTNFTLWELLQSQTATRYGIKEQFEPPENVIANLKALCIHALEPIRNLAGQPLKISSDYRCDRLNKAVSGSKTSQHVKGEAADIDLGSHVANKRLFELIKDKTAFTWDQLIWEYGDETGPSWVHVSYKDTGGNRKQIIKIV